MPSAPVNADISVHDLINDPYPIYRRMRADTPIVSVSALNRTLLTRAADCRAVKDNPAVFSSDDPNTPMERAFEAHTLMRKDGAAHMRERLAMMPTFSPRNLKSIWVPLYTRYANTYLDRLPRGEVVDLFADLAAPLAARILGDCMGLPDAHDRDLQAWSQALIDGAGNFGWFPEPFERVARANVAINACIKSNAARLRAAPDQSALSVMQDAADPIPDSQIVSNIKIAIGGGINEPRDALLTVLFGLLTNPDQLEEVRARQAWSAAFEEGLRWVAPIQVSSRVATQDTTLGDIDIPAKTVVMTVQASANRDEALFDDPDTYNALRAGPPHQSFGSGPHHCMGLHMARRMVGGVLLPMLFERFPNMALEHPQDVVWKGFGFRGPIALPVRLN